MLYNRRADRILIIALPAALFVYASTRPVLRLQGTMPAQFADIRPSVSAAQRAEEERIAGAYWNCAVTLMQWRYTYGSPLPEDPPDDFQIDAADAVFQRDAASSRLLYWQRLRRVWTLPQAWEASREWSTHWLTQPVSNGAEGIREYFRDLIRNG